MIISKRIVYSIALAPFALALTSSTGFAAEEFDIAKVLIEINATDGDAGFHALGDAQAWMVARIKTPEGIKIFQAKASDILLDQGLTEVFFESSEPLCDPEDAEEGEEFQTPAEFIDRFPAGEYPFRGKTLDGTQLKDSVLN